MDKAGVECVANFRDAVLQQFPLIASLDVDACKKHVRSLDTGKKVEWCLRSRVALRLCVGVLTQPELARQVFFPDHENHTVLCLAADLLQRLPTSLLRCPLPGAPTVPDAVTTNPMVQMRLVHLALYAAELEQDYELGLVVKP